MAQLYARVFVQILDSSLSEDWKARHVFEDFLKLADNNGVVDMTRQAFARRTNAPPDVVNDAIDRLEAPDPSSRDPEADGRRLIRLDAHRDWGWRIVNWEKYEAVRNAADKLLDAAERVRRHRDRKREHPKFAPSRAAEPSSPAPPSPQEPTAEAYTDTDSKGALPNVTPRYTPLQDVTPPQEEGVCVSPPKGFPASEAEAIEQAATLKVPEDIAQAAYHDALSRGGKDKSGHPVMCFGSYAKKFQTYRKSKGTEAAAVSGAKAPRQGGLLAGMFPAQRLRFLEDRNAELLRKIQPLTTGEERSRLFAEHRQVTAQLEALKKQLIAEDNK